MGRRHRPTRAETLDAQRQVVVRRAGMTWLPDKDGEIERIDIIFVQYVLK